MIFGYQYLESLPLGIYLQSLMRQHMASAHEGVTYPCDQCDAKTTSAYALITHKKAVHQRIKVPCSEPGVHIYTINVVKNSNVDPGAVGSGLIWVRGSGLIWFRGSGLIWVRGPGSGFRMRIRIQRDKMKEKAEFDQQKKIL